MGALIYRWNTSRRRLACTSYSKRGIFHR